MKRLTRAIVLTAAIAGTHVANADPVLESNEIIAASDPIGACATHMTSSATSYPDESARARRGGKVLLTVTVAADGAVADAAIRSSSGSRVLDGAALESALTKWRFAPSACGALIAKDVLVEFKPRTVYMFSATRYPEYRRQLLAAAARGCEVSQDGARKAVISCVDGAATARMRLAER